MSRMRLFVEWLVLSWGWQRRLAALAAGAVGALALSPFGIFPALIVSLSIAIWLIDGVVAPSRGKATLGAFATGWWFGFGYFLAGLWWLGSAFLVEADRFAWLMPLGVIALPAGLALFHGLGFAIARLFWSHGPARVLAFAAGLSISEWLRGNILTGFPWNTYGMALGEHLWLAQTASLVGLYGLTTLALFICAAPATLTAAESERRWRLPVIAVILMVAMTAFGGLRLPSKPSPLVADVRLRIMQPNLPQDAKFRVENRDDIMRRYLTLSDRATSPRATGVADVTHLIWPESAFPFLLARDATALAQIASLLPPGVTLITGAARAVEPLPGERAGRYRNAIHVVSDDGTILSSYDKVHLVPFGEYMPVGEVLNAFNAITGLDLRQFVAIPGGFEAGERRGLLAVPGLPAVAPLICYEAIFPGEVVPDGARPGLLLNVTNDAWFGKTPGPYQHFMQARLRAVEEGLPLVRAANTGISAVIDPYGRVLGSLPLGQEGVLDQGLPKSIGLTIYTRFGDVFFTILVVSLLLTSGAAAVRRRYAT
jgi:apolipoprotein N-acyltransferase